MRTLLTFLCLALAFPCFAQKSGMLQFPGRGGSGGTVSIGVITNNIGPGEFTFAINGTSNTWRIANSNYANILYGFVTNRAPGVSTNAPGLNVRLTNGTDNILLIAGVRVVPTNSGIAAVTLVVGDTNRYTISAREVATATTNVQNLIGVIPRGAPYYITNESTGQGKVIIESNNYFAVSLPTFGGGGVGTDANAIANSSGLGTNTSLFGDVNLETNMWVGPAGPRKSRIFGSTNDFRMGWTNGDVFFIYTLNTRKASMGSISYTFGDDVVTNAGTSYFEHTRPRTTAVYDLGTIDLYWRTGYIAQIRSATILVDNALNAGSANITGLATAAQFRVTGLRVLANATNDQLYITGHLGGAALISGPDGLVSESGISETELNQLEGLTSLARGIYDTNFNSINVTNDVRAQSFTGSGTSPGSLTLQGTNGNNAMLLAANSNSVNVTNIVGLLHKAAASVVTLDANHGNQFSITSRVAAATSVVLTNSAEGQDIEFTILGEASGGSSRVITVVPQLGHLVANLDTFGTALATSFSFTLTNGNAAEVSARIRKLNGTNIASVVTRQFSF